MPVHEYVRNARGCAAYLAAAGEAVEERDEGLWLATRHGGAIRIEWRADEEMVTFTLSTGVRWCEGHSLLLARINSELVVTGFRVRDGEVVFQTHAYLDGEGALSSEVVRRSVQACRATVSNYLEDLQGAGDA